MLRARTNKMFKEVFLFFVAVVALSKAEVEINEEDVSRNQRNSNWNEYYFFTKPMKNLPEKLTDANMNTLEGDTTLVIVHGHGGNYISAMNFDIARGVLDVLQEDANVIILDWSVQAATSYSTAEAVVPTVGRYLADELSLLNTVGVNPQRMHIVGFNLGAHVAGWAGRTLRDRGTPVARITALDPSACSNKMDRNDADYVEVIHTDTGSVLGNGLAEQLGDTDFYPNGGRSQPGCSNNSCCHNRAWELFAASLGWNTFRAHCCNTRSQMTLNTCRGSLHEMGNNNLTKVTGSCASGILRVNTGSRFPY